MNTTRWLLLPLTTLTLQATVIMDMQHPITAEHTARQELTQAIQKVTRNAPPETWPDIRLVHDPDLAPEEWTVRRQDGGPITICGGRPRGVLYGAYEFIERALEVTFCSLDFTHYPYRPVKTWPQTITWQGKPAFSYRNLYYLTKNFPREQYLRFHARSRMSSPILTETYGYSESPGRPGGCHTYLEYTRDFPPEIGWMDKTGKRIQVRTTAEGQLCYTHPEVRKRIARKLRDYIRQDQDECRKKGIPAPTVYNLSANDCDAQCNCPDCQNLIRNHGVSGLVLDFTNAIARDIRQDHPDIQLMCFAYKDAMAPPKGGIRAETNVIVQIAAMDLEFNHQAIQRDVLGTFDKPENKPYVDILKQWHDTGAKLAIWDYWKLYYDPFPSPKGYMTSRFDYIKAYHKLGATWIFIEAEIDPYKEMESFNDLRVYLAAKLMREPHALPQPTIQRFMNAFYGTAANTMTRYLKCLEDAMNHTEGQLSAKHVAKRTYLTTDFLNRCDSLLEQAAKQLENDPQRADHVAQEQLIVDLARANLNPDDAKKLHPRIEYGLNVWGKRYHTNEFWTQNRRQITQDTLAKLNRPPLPPQLAHLTALKDLCWTDFPRQQLGQDTDAAGGRCLALCQSSALKNFARKNEPAYLHREREPQCGIYSPADAKHLIIRKIPWTEVPQDQQFHWYHIGSTRLTPSARFWGHWTWYLGVSLNKLYDSAMPDRNYDLYVSLKLQGPHYVKHSTLPDDFKIDRIVAVPCGTPIRQLVPLK